MESALRSEQRVFFDDLAGEAEVNLFDNIIRAGMILDSLIKLVSIVNIGCSRAVFI